jgi:hypothetical protein
MSSPRRFLGGMVTGPFAHASPLLCPCWNPQTAPSSRGKDTTTAESMTEVNWRPAPQRSCTISSALRSVSDPIIRLRGAVPTTAQRTAITGHAMRVPNEICNCAAAKVSVAMAVHAARVAGAVRRVGQTPSSGHYHDVHLTDGYPNNPRTHSGSPATLRARVLPYTVGDEACGLAAGQRSVSMIMLV